MKKPLQIFREDLALKNLLDGEGGAELYALEGLAHLVLSGKQISPVFQSVVNAIVAKAVISEKLPTLPKGRQKNFMSKADGWGMANRHLELMDSGINYANAIEQVASEFEKYGERKISARQIERLVKEVKPAVEMRIGLTKSERQKFRDQVNRVAQKENPVEVAENIDRILAPVFALLPLLEEHLKEEAKRDHIADLDNLMFKALNQSKPDDIK